MARRAVMKESAKWRSGRAAVRWSTTRPGGRGGESPQAFRLDERVAGQDATDVMVPPGISSSHPRCHGVPSGIHIQVDVANMAPPSQQAQRIDAMEDPMKLSGLFLIIAALLFALSTIPKIQRPWMIGVGLALLECSFLPYFSLRSD